VGEPEELNTQAQSEQPKPRKRISSIHTSLRGIRFVAPDFDTRNFTSGNVLGRTQAGEERAQRCVAVMLPTVRVRESAAWEGVGWGHSVALTHAHPPRLHCYFRKAVALSVLLGQ
jgi:hypothetical protein